MSDAEQRLAALGLSLPEPSLAVANYVPFCRSAGLVHVSGQLSVTPERAVRGVVGVDLALDAARDAARLCGLNLLAQIRLACGGDLGGVSRIVKLTGFVQAGPQFSEIPAVINGCSDLMVEVFGDRGRHARSAVGVYRLPLNAAVEVDAMVELG